MVTLDQYEMILTNNCFFNFSQFEQLAFHMAQTQKEGGAFGGMLRGNNRHVVVCGSSLRPTLVLDFLKEFYAQSDLEV